MKIRRPRLMDLSKYLEFEAFANRHFCLVVFLVFFCYSEIGFTRDHSLQLSAQGGMYSFEVTNEDAGVSGGGISGVGAYSLTMAYGFFHRFQVFGGFSLIASQTIGGDIATGFDAGVKYFPFSTHGGYLMKERGIHIEMIDQLRPYIGVAARLREFISTINATYVGPGVLAGVDVDLSDTWFINAEARMDSLIGVSGAQATQTNILIGFGIYF